VETITAASLKISERRTIYTHPGTGAETQVFTIARQDRNEPLPLSDALDQGGILAAIAVFGLAIFIPGIAAGLVAGAPQLGAGAAVATTAALGGTAIAGGMLTAGAARLAGRTSGSSIRAAASLTGRVGAAYEAAGPTGVARTLTTATASRLIAARTAPILDAYREGAAQGYRDAGPPAGSAPGGGPIGGGPRPGPGPGSGGAGGAPGWARSLARRQRLTQAGLIAAGALREGDRGTISPGPDLKNKS
jgi:type IV secretion system protein TrbL